MSVVQILLSGPFRIPIPYSRFHGFHALPFNFPVLLFVVARVLKALMELKEAGLLPASHDQAAALAARIKQQGPHAVVLGVLAQVRLLGFSYGAKRRIRWGQWLDCQGCGETC